LCKLPEAYQKIRFCPRLLKYRGSIIIQMAEGVSERVAVSFTPITQGTVDDTMHQIGFRPEVIYAEERAYLNTFEKPLLDFVERSAALLQGEAGSEAAEAYLRGVYIMHELFRRQAGWRERALPPVTENLCKAYVQDNFEGWQEENSSVETIFHSEGDRLELEEGEIVPLFDKLREIEGDNFVYVKGGLADLYFLYRKAMKTADLEAKFKVAPE